MCDGIMQKEAINILQFLHLAEKLKSTLRHGWTSTGRQESVAEHSWRLSLMVILCQPHLGKEINLEKALQMAIVHDLCEAITGDVPFFEALEGSKAQKSKHCEEEQAMKSISDAIGGETGRKLYAIWNEYHLYDSEEAKLIKALDKIEAQIQQNEADLSTWIEFEKLSIFTYLDKFCDYNEFMKALKDEVRKESVLRLQGANLVPSLL